MRKLSTVAMILTLCALGAAAWADQGGGTKQFATVTTLTLDRSSDTEGSTTPVVLTSHTVISGTTQAPPNHNVRAQNVSYVRFFVDDNVYAVGDVPVDESGTASCEVDIRHLSSENGHTFRSEYLGFAYTDPNPNEHYDSSQSDAVPFTVNPVVAPPGDLGAPTTTPTVIDGTPGTNGWYRSAVTVTLTATDPDGASDVVEIHYWVDDPTNMLVAPGNVATITFPGGGTADGIHFIWYSAVDKAGKAEECVRELPKAFSVKLDTTPPTITAQADRAPNAAGWYKDDVIVSFTCSDTTSGVLAYPVPVILGEGANQEAVGTVFDQAGNSAAASLKGMNIDKTRPTLAFGGQDPPANRNGWNNTPVSIPFTPDDALSGVDTALTPGGPLHFDAEGKGQTKEVVVTDLAGNSATFTSPAVSIDMTPPTITITPADGTTSDLCSGVPTPSYTTGDNLSEVDSQGTGTLTKPGTASGAGLYVYTVSGVTDKAGNSASKTATYQVMYAGAFSGVLQPINANGSSLFKLGSTVPVKFRLACGTTPIPNAVAKLLVAKISDGVAGTDLEAISTSAADSGNQFRYDPTAGQYIFNLSTKPLSQGTWQLKIVLDDGFVYTVNISTRK